ncbi:MAG: aspartate 1-decarboxylase [Bdellovibrionota bacterium]
MQRTLLKSKVYRLKVTHVEPALEECLKIDREILRGADIWPFERVEVYNHENGARFSTVVQPVDQPVGGVVLGGAASNLVQRGHLITVVAFVSLSEQDLLRYSPKVVRVNSENRVMPKD